MHFIDDVNLESALRGLIANIFDDLSDFVDAAIRCTVNFQNIDRIAIRNLFAMAALIAGPRSRAPLAV